MMVRTLGFLLLCVLLTSMALGQGGQPIYQGSLGDFQASPHLSVSLTKDQTVSYAIQLSSNYVYGTSVSVEGFNHEGVSLFSKSIYTGSAGNVVTAMLPAGIGHLDPYRGTAHAVGRPSYLVVKSLWAQVNYSVFETKNERDGYNQGGLSRAQAKQISVFERVRGNAHWIEGNDLAPGDGTEPGGQWFKVTLEPRQTIRPEGTVLGHSYYGAAFTIQLCDESGSYLATLAGISAYGNVPFPTTQAPGSYLYQNTASEPKTFYLQVYSKVGIVHDYEFSLVEIKMDFSIKSQTINEQNKYSEDSLIEIQAVRGDTRAALANFSGNVYISEINGNTYSQNGGSLPSTVNIPAGAGGKAEFLAKSLVGPQKDKAVGLRMPKEAELQCKSFRQLDDASTDDEPLKVKQWFSTSDPPNDVPDWLAARVNDLFVLPNLTAADQAARDAVESYSVADLGREKDGETPIDLLPTLPLRLNPFNHQGMRLNQSVVAGTCGPLVAQRYLTAVLFHEARHCYQGSEANQVGKNADRDLLVNAPYGHAPTDAPVDSTVLRVVCDYVNRMIVPDWIYLGDSVQDGLHSPNNASWGLEFDAYWFMAIQRPY